MRLRSPKPSFWAGLGLPLMVCASLYTFNLCADLVPSAYPLFWVAFYMLGVPLVLIVVWLLFLWVVFRVTRHSTFSLLRIGSVAFFLVCASAMVFCMYVYLS